MSIKNKYFKGGDLVDYVNIVSIFYLIGVILLILSFIFITINRQIFAIIFIVGFGIIILGTIFSPFVKLKRF